MLQGTGSAVGTSLPAAELACAGFTIRSVDMTLLKHPKPSIEI